VALAVVESEEEFTLADFRGKFLSALFSGVDGGGPTTDNEVRLA
jgi:hypothetical protein